MDRTRVYRHRPKMLSHLQGDHTALCLLVDTLKTLFPSRPHIPPLGIDPTARFVGSFIFSYPSSAHVCVPKQARIPDLEAATVWSPGDARASVGLDDSASVNRWKEEIDMLLVFVSLSLDHLQRSVSLTDLVQVGSFHPGPGPLLRRRPSPVRRLGPSPNAPKQDSDLNA